MFRNLKKSSQSTNLIKRNRKSYFKNSLFAKHTSKIFQPSITLKNIFLNKGLDSNKIMHGPNLSDSNVGTDSQRHT